MSTKELGLTVATSLWSAGFFGALAYALSRATSDVSLWIALGVVAIIEAALLCGTLGFVKHIGWRSVTIAVPPIVLMLAGLFSLSSILGAVLCTLFLLSAHRAITWEMNNRLRFQLWPMFSATARMVTLGVLLGAIGLGYPWLLRQIEAGSVHVQPTSLSSVVRPIEPFLRTAIPGYTTDMTIDQLISLQVNNAAEKAAGNSLVLPGDQQHQAVLTQIQQQFGTTVRGNDSVPTLLAGAINRQLSNVTTRFPLVVTLLVIVVLFLTLRTLIPFLIVPVLALLWILVWLGRQTGFIRLTTETAEVERVTL